MTPMRWLLVLALCIASVAAAWLSTPITELNSGRDFDGVYYAAIAEYGAGGWHRSAYSAAQFQLDPSFQAPLIADTSALARVAPWCWRIATPWLAAQLPFSAQANVRLLCLLYTSDAADE